MANVNDDFRIVFNEHVRNPDGSLTVNAVHMYLLGPAALGDVLISLSTCGSNRAPLPVADFDGDGDTDVAVYRPSLSVWFVQGGATTAWGTEGDASLPLPGAIRGSFFPPH